MTARIDLPRSGLLEQVNPGDAYSAPDLGVNLIKGFIKMPSKQIMLYFNNEKNKKSTNRKFDFVNNECHISIEDIAVICKEVGVLPSDFENIDIPSVRAIYSNKNISFDPAIDEFGDVVVTAIEDQ